MAVRSVSPSCCQWVVFVEPGVVLVYMLGMYLLVQVSREFLRVWCLVWWLPIPWDLPEIRLSWSCSSVSRPCSCYVIDGCVQSGSVCHSCSKKNACWYFCHNLLILCHFMFWLCQVLLAFLRNILQRWLGNMFEMVL